MRRSHRLTPYAFYYTPVVDTDPFSTSALLDPFPVLNSNDVSINYLMNLSIFSVSVVLEK